MSCADLRQRQGSPKGSHGVPCHHQTRPDPLWQATGEYKTSYGTVEWPTAIGTRFGSSEVPCKGQQSSYSISNCLETCSQDTVMRVASGNGSHTVASDKWPSVPLTWHAMLCIGATLIISYNHCHSKGYMPCSMLSKLVVFDTNVYMNHNHWDAKVIMQLLHAWILISPSIVILVPIVSFCLCLAICPSLYTVIVQHTG